MSSQEVLTLQFGTYSNFVGTHYWNIQQKRLNESNNESLTTEDGKIFRENISNKKHIHVPRMICFDVKKSLKALNEDGTFHTEDVSEEINEDGPVVYAQDAIEKNEFITQMMSSKPSTSKQKTNLDDKVTTWTDYLMCRLDENSIQLMKNNYNDGKDFNYFGLGEKEFDCLRDDIEDKLHYWIEECNNMEGFQVCCLMNFLSFAQNLYIQLIFLYWDFDQVFVTSETFCYW